MDDQILIQGCGCVAIPEAVALLLGMSPGVTLKMTVDEVSHSITLTAPVDASVRSNIGAAACPILL